MTHVNAKVPYGGEIYDRRAAVLLEAELAFYKKMTETLRDELENIFDHALSTGHVELWKGREKIDLYTSAKSEVVA
jgi:hypothetical protein